MVFRSRDEVWPSLVTAYQLNYTILFIAFDHAIICCFAPWWNNCSLLLSPVAKGTRGWSQSVLLSTRASSYPCEARPVIPRDLTRPLNLPSCIVCSPPSPAGRTAMIPKWNTGSLRRSMGAMRNLRKWKSEGLPEHRLPCLDVVIQANMVIFR